MDIQYTNQFTAIFIAHLLAVMSPGQDFALISRQAFIFGRNVAAFSSLGIAFGILFHISYCILGINIFLSSHDYLYKIFKYLCSIYLFYLGIISYFNKNTSIQSLNEHDMNLKYGYDRVTDWCSIHIRRGRMKREEAIQIAREEGGKYPHEYLGIKLEDVLKEIGCDKNRFDKICNNFTNKKIFKLDSSGVPIRDNHNNLIKINYDNLN